MDKYINSIIHGDCLDIMRDIPDKSIDLVLTDPPYGIGIKSTIGGNNLCKVKNYKSFDDSKIPDKKYFEELFRISKNQIIFGGNYFIEHLKNTSCFIIWDKMNTGNFADAELLWTSFKTSTRIYKYKWNGMIQEDMKNKQIRKHPTEKPINLLINILKNYSNESDLIFDGFAGSGTTALACIELNRRFICVEKDLDYYNIAKKRIEDEQSQLRLF